MVLPDWTERVSTSLKGFQVSPGEQDVCLDLPTSACPLIAWWLFFILPFSLLSGLYLYISLGFFGGWFLEVARFNLPY